MTSMILLWRTAVVFVLGGGTVLLCLFSPSPEAGDHAGIELALPERVLGMEGEALEMSAAERDILPADTGYLRRHYRGTFLSGAAAELTCTIVLSASDRRSLHRPEVCLPGQGWTIDSAEVIPVPRESREDFEVKRLGLSRVVNRGDGTEITLRAIYLYWYVGRDRTTPSTAQRVLISASDNIFRNVNHRWAYVSVMSLVPGSHQPDGRDAGETLDLLEDFIRESAPRFER